MRDALVYEWTRIRTIRSTWWLTGIAVALGVLIALAIAWPTAHELSVGKESLSDDDVRLIGPITVTALAGAGAPSVIGFVLAMVGVFAWGHEYRHGMIRASLTALNSRRNLWIAKYFVAGAWAAVVSFVTSLLAAVVTWLFLHSHHVEVFHSLTWEVVGRQIGYVVILTWLAMAFTSITRSQAFALVFVFLWPLVVESLIAIIVELIPFTRHHDDLLRFLPFAAGYRMIDVTTSADSFFGNPLSPGGGAVIFGGVMVVLMIVSWVLFGRRDA